jgi:Bacterial Ig domain
VDGVLVGSDSTVPYRMGWDSRSVSDGPRTITLRAEDAAGNATTSQPVVVSVSNSATLPPPPPPDTTLPTVGLTGPAPGAVVAGAVVVSAFASDDTGVAGVQFLVDGVALGGEDPAPPYQVTWSTPGVADGAHTLSARARDIAGNMATSAPVTVTVRNPPDPEPNPDPDPGTAAMGNGVVRMSIDPSTTGFREVRARTDGGDRMELYIDGERVADVSGRSLTYEWDVRGLMGGREVRVVTLEGAGIVASTSLFYPVGSVESSVVRLEVVTLPILGATYIRAHATVTDPVRMELYIDGDLRLAQDDPDFEYAWAPQPGRAYEILFVTYDDSGLIASVQVGHIP